MSLSNSPLIDQVATSILEKLRVNPNLLQSAVSLMQVGADVMRNITEAGSSDERKKVLLAVLEKLAAGADGVQGTADDLIPQDIMTDLRLLLQTKLASDIISLMNLDSETIKKCGCGCLPF